MKTALPALVPDELDLLTAFDGRPPLAGIGVICADTHLQHDPHELHLIAHRLEEELLERVAGLVELAGVELGDGGDEAGVVLELHGVTLHRMVRGLAANRSGCPTLRSAMRVSTAAGSTGPMS